MRAGSRLFFFLCVLNFDLVSQDGLQPIAAYSFNDATTNDDVGKLNAKAVGVSFVADRFKNPRSACFLHGNYGSYLNLGTDKTLKPRAGTISLWLKMDIPMLGGKGVHVNPIILTKSHSGDDFYDAYTIVYDFDIRKIVAATTLSEHMQLTIHATDTISLHKWHHIALTYDDHFTCLYLDGELNVKMAKNFESKFLENDSVMIGNSANTKNHRFLCASVDDIFIYDKVLSPDEIKNLYNAPDPNKWNSYFKWLFYGAIVLVIIAVLFFIVVRRYKKKLDAEKEKHRMQLRMNELETKAIRTQMNPHFLFNALNTLQRFILEKDLEKAEEYIGVFAKLLRKLLESSVAETITLSEEIDILEKYVQIEKLRFEDEFEYAIHCDIKDAENVKIPFMMVQPFVENAIWHGLLPAETRRKLTITFSGLDPKRIICTIDDNGVGRDYSARVKDPLKKRSLAMDFIRQRLELLSGSVNVECSFKVLDKKTSDGTASGTTIELILPVLNV